MSYVCLTVLLANSLCLSYFMYIIMSDNIGFCLNILHFDWCLCNFVLADWAFGSVFIIVLNINCLTKNDLSGILDTTDTNFLHPCPLAPLNEGNQEKWPPMTDYDPHFLFQNPIILSKWGCLQKTRPKNIHFWTNGDQFCTIHTGCPAESVT